MSDQVTRTEVVGFGGRLKDSIIGVFLGLLLFFGSFFVLFWNEGRVDLSKVAETAIEISATTATPAEVGKLVSTTGPVTSSESLDDDLFLRPAKYVAINRKVEMYAWEETESTKTRKNAGGSEVRTTTYSYTKEWTQNPENSSSFEEPANHQNPTMPFRSEEFRVSSAQIGGYTLNMSTMVKLQTPDKIPINPQTVQADKMSDPYVFQGKGSLSNPEVGDLRVSYTALNNGATATVFGQLVSADRIDKYLGPRQVPLYHLFVGDRATSIQTLSNEHQLLTWILRGAGFLMMWIGSSLFFEPISVFLDLLPFLGNISRSMVGLITFALSLALSVLTILLSIVVHNPIILILCLLIVGFLGLRQARKRS